MKDIAERYFVVRSQVCKSRKQKSSVSSDNLCAIASFTPLPISYVLREDLVFDILQACRSTSLSWISTFCLLTFCYFIKSWKLDWWNSMDFTLNLNPCVLTYTWFIHKGKSKILLNVLQFEPSVLTYSVMNTHGHKWNVIEEYETWRATLKATWINLIKPCELLTVIWIDVLKVGCRVHSDTFKSVAGSGPTVKCHRRELREDIMIQLPVSVWWKLRHYYL